MHPVDQRRLALFQRFGGADIGLHHHLLDQFVRLQRLARGDRDDLALGADDDAALSAFDLQRSAADAGGFHGGVGGPQRLQDRFQQGTGGIVRPSVDGGLGLFVGQLGGRAHQAALELVAALASRGVEHHPHGHAGARLALDQAAQAVR